MTMLLPDTLRASAHLQRQHSAAATGLPRRAEAGV
jgi:hypothetical protein